MGSGDCSQSLKDLWYEEQDDERTWNYYSGDDKNRTNVVASFKSWDQPILFHRNTRILQARIRKWVAILFSKGTSRPRDQNQVSCTVGRFFTTEPPGTPNRPQISQIVLTHFQLKFIFLGLKKLENRHISFVYLPLSPLILNSGPIHACI